MAGLTTLSTTTVALSTSVAYRSIESSESTQTPKDRERDTIDTIAKRAFSVTEAP